MQNTDWNPSRCFFEKVSFIPLPTSSKHFFKKCTNKIGDYGVTYGFYSNGNNERNRNELGRQLIHQLDAL